ncbi:nickel-binding protein [Alterinioella nitratireducens]|uniref:nickel-binding protein n=1 Tax=Alterinioella nitratireducens TaxID=2735915 RepID=UPI004058C7E5
MKLYMIRRRSIWANEDELAATNKTSAEIGSEMADRLRWIRSYAVNEADGRIGSVCFYEADSPDAIREHGNRIGAPSEEILPVGGAAVKQPDPQPVQYG